MTTTLTLAPSAITLRDGGAAPWNAAVAAAQPQAAAIGGADVYALDASDTFIEAAALSESAPCSNDDCAHTLPARAREPATRKRWWLPRAQARTGLAITATVLLVALAGPWLAPHAPTAFVGPVYGAPTLGAPFGFDALGRDVLSRVLSGGWSVVWMSAAAAAFALLAGAALGLFAGYRRGWPDQAINWASDTLLAFPNLILVLLVVAMLGRDPALIVLTTAIAFVPGVVRLARGMTLAIANQEFVEAAVLLGFSRRRILLREILPNVLTPLLIHFGTMLSWSVAILSSLSFLGYGVAPPTADWGLMINENRAGLQAQPWAVLAPVVLVALFALGANLLAEGLGRAGAKAGAR